MTKYYTYYLVQSMERNPSFAFMTFDAVSAEIHILNKHLEEQKKELNKKDAYQEEKLAYIQKRIDNNKYYLVKLIEYLSRSSYEHTVDQVDAMPHNAFGMYHDTFIDQPGYMVSCTKSGASTNIVF